MRLLTHRTFFKRVLYILGIPFLNFHSFLFGKSNQDSGMIYFANNLKITELLPGSILISTRLCAALNPVNSERFDSEYRLR